MVLFEDPAVSRFSAFPEDARSLAAACPLLGPALRSACPRCAVPSWLDPGCCVAFVGEPHSGKVAYGYVSGMDRMGHLIASACKSKSDGSPLDLVGQLVDHRFWASGFVRRSVRDWLFFSSDLDRLELGSRKVRVVPWDGASKL